MDNLGANSLPSYIDTVVVVLIYESPGLPNLDNYNSWSSYPNDKQGMIPFSVSSLPTSWVQDAARIIDWIYVTNDALPNPWDSLPSYFDELASLLDNGSTSNAEDTLNSGQTYQVAVPDFGSCVFDHWEDGSKNRSRTITPGSDLIVTAYYKQ